MQKYIVLDTETGKDRQLTELAAIALSYNKGKVVETKRFSCIIDKKNSISSTIEQFNRFVGQPSSFIAHNVSFDLRVLQYTNSSLLKESICTVKLARQIKDEEYPFINLMLRTPTGKVSRNLASVYTGLFGTCFAKQHTALADTTALTRIVLHPLFRRYIFK